MSLRKRQRSASSSRLTAFCSPPSSPAPPSTSSSPNPHTFPNADVVLRLYLNPSSPDDVDVKPDIDRHLSAAVSSGTFVDLHVSSASLLRSRYFAALLSDRWPTAASGHLSLAVVAPPSCPRPFNGHIEVIRLLHTRFRECHPLPRRCPRPPPRCSPPPRRRLRWACIRFLEAVSWSEDKEARVINLARLLPADEAADLLARVSPLVAAGGWSFFRCGRGRQVTLRSDAARPDPLGDP